jgi:PIN domain nuclease of toxin-antitoxin system
MVLLDTCALLWWTLDPEKLSPKAAKVCDRIATKGGVVSSISIWEIGIKIKKGELEIGLPLEDYVGRLKQLSGLEIVPVDEIIWMRGLDLDWKHRDPADRTIVATASLRKIPIVTCDEDIQKFYRRVIW